MPKDYSILYELVKKQFYEITVEDEKEVEEKKRKKLKLKKNIVNF